jgi:pilus assembly protein CpaF
MKTASIRSEPVPFSTPVYRLSNQTFLQKANAMMPVEIYRTTVRHFLGPILSLMDDPEVTEIMVIGPKVIYYEKKGRLYLSELKFPGTSALMALVQNIGEYVNRRLDARHSSMDARLPDGSRVHVILPPASRRGICLTIRKFQKSSFDLRQLVAQESLSPAAAEFLEIAVLLHKNIVISGGTGTGKTSLLNALSAAIPEYERIIVIEDSSELQLHQPHTVYLESQPAQLDGRGQITIRDLFVESLRMRPDRIVVGEVRRGEALDLIQSMLSGHAGSLTTVHANTPRDAASRLETLCLMSDAAIPIHVARTQVASAIHVVVQLARFADGSRRVQAISESLGLDDQQRYCWQDLFLFEGCGCDEEGRLRGGLHATGNRPSFAREPFQMGFKNRVRHTASMFCEKNEKSASGFEPHAVSNK